jgi:predicted nucleotidyltransferase
MVPVVAQDGVTTRREIDPMAERAVRSFLRRVQSCYPVADAIVYGSHARGDQVPGSDVDLAVVLEGEPGRRDDVVGEMAKVEFQVLLETGVLVHGLPLWTSDIEAPERIGNPALIANILREGVQM